MEGVKNNQNNAIKRLSVNEFVPLMASLMALVALSIDAILPALDRIESDFEGVVGNEVQLVVSMLFLGLAIGQLFFGTLSDFVGRKPAVALGIVLFIVGCLLSFFAADLQVLLLGRVMQGIGLSGPRIISIALVRDQYEGTGMARIMSFVMSIFIVVPAVAPMLGQLVLNWAHWRYIFLLLLSIGSVVLVWFVIRQPETLKKERRQAFSLSKVGSVIFAILSNRISLGYTLIAGLVAGMFLGFLSSIQQIFKAYGYADLFVYGFAILALFIGTASLVNAKAVLQYGVKRMVGVALVVLCATSAFYLLVGWLVPLNFAAAMTYLIIAVFFIGILFGNLNAQAMAPLGAVAGIGSSMVGSLSTLISVPFGILIGSYFDNSIMPLLLGFLSLSVLSLILFYWTERSNYKVLKV